MVEVKVGDLFESKAQTLVNTVNTVGVMGKGVALEFRKRFPDMYEDYVERCKRKLVRLGEPYLFRRAEPPGLLVGRTIMQKIAYFAAELGIPTGVEHEQASYGPFAPGLKKVLTRLVNNGLLEEQPMGRMIRLSVGPTFDDARRAYTAE